MVVLKAALRTVCLRIIHSHGSGLFHFSVTAKGIHKHVCTHSCRARLFGVGM